jgi:hypothetical protein
VCRCWTWSCRRSTVSCVNTRPSFRRAHLDTHDPVANYWQYNPPITGKNWIQFLPE